MYRIIDVTDWIYKETLQVSGTREKRWLKHEDISPDTFLFKLPKATTNEAWAEKVTSEIGKKLGFNMMDVDFATNNDTNAVLLKNFSPGSKTMADGGEIISAFLNDFDPDSLVGYSIENIIKSLSKHPLLGNSNFESEFISMCIFDAFVANQDRHCENWAIILNSTSYFAPIYDNGASLGFNSSKDKMLKMISDKNMLNAFNNRSKTLIEVEGKKKPKALTLLSYLKKLYPEKFKKEMTKIFSFNEGDIIHILEQVPNDFMNDLEKEWVQCLLISRRNWLCEWYEEDRR